MVKRFERFRMQRVNFWVIAKIALALALMGVVVWNVRWEDVLALWRRLSLVWVAPSIAIFFAVTWLNARRYWILIGKRPIFRAVLGVVVFQTALTNLVATVAGAAWYVTQLKTRHQVELKSSVASALLARVCDLIVLLPILIVSSVTVWSQIEVLHGLVALVVTGIASFMLIAFAVLIGRSRAIEFLQWLAHRFGVQETLWARRALNSLDKLAQIEPARASEIFRAALWYAVLILAMSLLFAYVNLQLFALALPLPAILFVSVLALVISYIPIQVLGGLGVFEVTTLYLYTLFGLPAAEVLAFVLSARLYSWLLNGILLVYPLATSRAES